MSNPKFEKKDTSVFNVFQPTELKRDVPTLVDMINACSMLVKQQDLHDCTDKEFAAVCEFVNWHYMDSLGANLGTPEPTKPDIIEIF